MTTRDSLRFDDRKLLPDDLEDPEHWLYGRPGVDLALYLRPPLFCLHGKASVVGGSDLTFGGAWILLSRLLWEGLLWKVNSVHTLKLKFDPPCPVTLDLSMRLLDPYRRSAGILTPVCGLDIPLLHPQDWKRQGCDYSAAAVTRRPLAVVELPGPDPSRAAIARNTLVGAWSREPRCAEMRRDGRTAQEMLHATQRVDDLSRRRRRRRNARPVRTSLARRAQRPSPRSLLPTFARPPCLLAPWFPRRFFPFPQSLVQCIVQSIWRLRCARQPLRRTWPSSSAAADVRSRGTGPEGLRHNLEEVVGGCLARELMRFPGVGRLCGPCWFSTRGLHCRANVSLRFLHPRIHLRLLGAWSRLRLRSHRRRGVCAPASQLKVADAHLPIPSYQPFESSVSIALPPLPDSSRYCPEPLHRRSHYMRCEAALRRPVDGILARLGGILEECGKRMELRARWASNVVRLHHSEVKIYFVAVFLAVLPLAFAVDTPLGLRQPCLPLVRLFLCSS
ncbi:hypothetical protein OH76DRAFT_1556307 [Lentinus brumalis]|uniref:Uncharacterized protein n=1 Tax=Lentinus brumalis TaxID=2498619 RepID=A0A371DAW6_9APHY|nr:hypothetical protein OH76DRAFT_1556307 [Polyporus brumalis]